MCQDHSHRNSLPGGKTLCCITPKQDKVDKQAKSLAVGISFLFRKIGFVQIQTDSEKSVFAFAQKLVCAKINDSTVF